jgi:hypothetical protein
VFAKRSLIAGFNRLTHSIENILYRCNSFLLQKDSNGHPRDGERERGKCICKCCCNVSRVPVENYDERLYIQASKPNRRTTATTTTTTNGDAHQEIQKNIGRGKEKWGEGDSEQRK